MRRAPSVCAMGVMVGCFAPESNGGGTEGGLGSTGAGTDTAASSSGGDSTAADTNEGTTHASDSTGETNASGDESGSSTSLPPADTSTSSTESTGPSTIDADGPYGDCDPERSCPANGPLGCVHTDTGTVCLPDCDVDECPDVEGPTAPFCVQLVGGHYGCLILCQEDSHCPAGLTCQSGFSTSEVCAWPS